MYLCIDKRLYMDLCLFSVVIADESHLCYIPDILSAMEEAARVKGNSIVVRAPEYLACKMREGKAVIAVKEGVFVGFCYVETWQGEQYVANSGLIVCPEFRGLGVAGRIKRRIFELCRQRYPNARIFSITKSPAVRKMNAALGFKEVPYGELTTDACFWQGCSTCRHYSQLLANGMKDCECIGMLYLPPSEANDL